MNDQYDSGAGAIGYFNYANSYRLAAIKLCDTKLGSTHPEAPVRFLFSHSIELFLKTVLRKNGLSLNEIKDHYQHGFKKLFNKARDMGLVMNSPLLEQIIEQGFLDNASEYRYLKVGGKKEILVSDLMHGCNILALGVAEMLSEMPQWRMEEIKSTVDHPVKLEEDILLMDVSGKEWGW